MPFDLAFDPITQDEIDDGHGSPKLTDRADTAVQLAFLIHYQQAWQDPELGSRFHDLSLFQGDPEQLAAVEAERVLKRLVDQRRIAAEPRPEVDVDEPFPGRIDVATTFRDANTGQVVTTKIRTGG